MDNSGLCLDWFACDFNRRECLANRQFCRSLAIPLLNRVEETERDVTTHCLIDRPERRA